MDHLQVEWTCSTFPHGCDPNPNPNPYRCSSTHSRGSRRPGPTNLYLMVMQAAAARTPRRRPP